MNIFEKNRENGNMKKINKNDNNKTRNILAMEFADKHFSLNKLDYISYFSSDLYHFAYAAFIKGWNACNKHKNSCVNKANRIKIKKK